MGVNCSDLLSRENLLQEVWLADSLQRPQLQGLPQHHTEAILSLGCLNNDWAQRGTRAGPFLHIPFSFDGQSLLWSPLMAQTSSELYCSLDIIPPHPWPFRLSLYRCQISTVVWGSSHSLLFPLFSSLVGFSANKFLGLLILSLHLLPGEFKLTQWV